jgi:basic membrane protein A and related proteins
MQERKLRLPVLVGLVALTLVLGALAGCGDDDDGGGGGGASTTDNSDVRVAMLATGAVNNRSWANSWTDGVKRAADELGVEVTTVGNVETPDQYTQQGASFAAKGYDLIIFAHGAMNEPAVKLARQFPDVQFVQAPYQFVEEGEQEAQPPNLGHVDFKQEQGSFLAGALAGLVTETNKVAAVYAFPFPALTRQPEAYSLGARCTNPDVTFSQKATNSFTDAALARAAASSLYSAGNDVIFSAVDQAVQGIIAAANSSQTTPAYVIASYFDQHDLGPKVVLTSVLYNLDGVAEDIIKTYTDDKMTDHWYKTYDLKNGDVGKLAPYQNLSSAVSEEDQQTLDTITRAVENGDIQVPDAVEGSPTIGKPGSAEKIDPESIGCTAEMSGSEG